MLDLQVVSEFVHRHFENVNVSSNGSHFLARCVLCGDSSKSKSKRRYNLDYNNGNPIWHCFNCDESGSFLEIYCRLEGVDIDEAKKILFGFDPDYLTQRLSRRKKKKIVKEIEHENHNWLLDDCIGLNREIDYILYVPYLNILKEFYKTRKIDKDFDIFIAYKGDYKNRLIIPIYDEYNQIVYFQARRIPGSPLAPKYKNPTLTKGGVVLNKNKFDREKHIVVVEGVIDAFTIGTQGTCSFGTSITEELLKELLSLTDKGVIIALDNDKPGYVSLHKFMLGHTKRKRVTPKNKYANRVKYFLFPEKYKGCKDINNIRTTYDINNIYDMIVDNSYEYSKTLVKLKLSKLF